MMRMGDCSMVRGPKKKLRPRDRFSLTLAPRQRKVLEAIAKKNDVALAHVLRYALNEFIENHRDGQLHLEFPRLPGSGNLPEK